VVLLRRRAGCCRSGGQDDSGQGKSQVNAQRASPCSRLCGVSRQLSVHSYDGYTRPWNLRSGSCSAGATMARCIAIKKVRSFATVACARSFAAHAAAGAPRFEPRSLKLNFIMPFRSTLSVRHRQRAFVPRLQPMLRLRGSERARDQRGCRSFVGAADRRCARAKLPLLGLAAALWPCVRAADAPRR
jgi:hypothetical protein